MSDIVYRFVSSGHESVERAFIGIEAAAKRSARGVETAYAGQAQAARRSASGQESAARRPADRLSQLAKQVERDQIRADQRVVRERQRSLDFVARVRERHFAMDQRRRESDVRAEKQHQDRLASVHQLGQERLRRIRESAEDRRTTQRRQFQARSADRLRDERRATLGRIGGELKGAVIGGSATVIAGSSAVGGAAIGQALGLQGAANRISINARKSGEGFIDPTVLRKEFEATAVASNGTVKAEQVADAVQRYITMTGDVGAARKMQGTFATVASATGADIGDIAETAASISQQFDIKSMDQFRESLALLTMQGKEGAFELSDAASQYQRLAASAASFNIGTGVGAVRTLGGITQIARSGTGSPEQAATAVENLFTNLKLKSDKLEREGVDIYTRNKQGDVTGTRALPEIITDIITKVGGTDIDVKNAMLSKILGEQGIRSINPLIGTFTQTFQGTKGSEKERLAAARAAVSGRLSAAINAPGSFKDIELDAAQAQHEPATKLDQVWSRLTASMADRMVPAIERMVDKIEASPAAIDLFVGSFEAMLDILETFGELFGIIDSKSPEYKKRQEQKRIKGIDNELASLPSDAKVDALMAQGKTAEAEAMRQQLRDPEVNRKIFRLQAEKNISKAAIDSIDTFEQKATGVRTGAEFSDLYTSLAADTNDPVQRRVAEAAAKDIARMGASSSYAGDGVVGVDETEQQARLRKQFAQTVGEQRVLAGGKAEGEGAEIAAKGLAAMLERITKSAGPAAAALEKVGAAAQPSISSG